MGVPSTLCLLLSCAPQWIRNPIPMKELNANLLGCGNAGGAPASPQQLAMRPPPPAPSPPPPAPPAPGMGMSPTLVPVDPALGLNPGMFPPDTGANVSAPGAAPTAPAPPAPDGASDAPQGTDPRAMPASGLRITFTIGGEAAGQGRWMAKFGIRSMLCRDSRAHPCCSCHVLTFQESMLSSSNPSPSRSCSWCCAKSEQRSTASAGTAAKHCCCRGAPARVSGLATWGATPQTAFDSILLQAARLFGGVCRLCGQHQCGASWRHARGAAAPVGAGAGHVAAGAGSCCHLRSSARLAGGPAAGAHTSAGRAGVLSGSAPAQPPRRQVVAVVAGDNPFRMYEKAQQAIK